MIEPQPTFAGLAAFNADVTIIGGGPVGIISALALARKGFRVLILESGQNAPSKQAQALSEGENLRPDNHYAPNITVARRLGGTSNLWGGRCLPYDPIDHQSRPWLGLPAWPVQHAELEAYLDQACRMLGAGDRACYRAPVSDLATDDAFSFDSLERWSNVPRTHVLHKVELETRRDLLVALGTTATGFQFGPSGRIERISTHLEGEGHGSVAVRDVILAAGGNESTRLLLSERQRNPHLFCDQLGRNYMGHLAGCIADIEFDSTRFHDGLDFHVDQHASYVRRRIIASPQAQRQHGLANIAFWPVVPEIHDPRHRSGPLSAVFLALSIPPLGRRLVAEPIRLRHVGKAPARRIAHIRNMLLNPLATMGFAPWFLWKSKFSSPRLPGLFLTNPARRYGLEFHSEHLPSPESRLSLSSARDRLGLPRLTIDLRFSQADAESILRAHDAIEGWLGRNGLARLVHRHDPEQRIESILAQAIHGNHQIGTIRMGSSCHDAIVDGDCRSFDIPNLAVVSTAVLPTSGHGNPTMAAVQLGLRLADRMTAKRHAPVRTEVAPATA